MICSRWFMMSLVMLLSVTPAWAANEHEPHLSRSGAAVGLRTNRDQHWMLLSAQVSNPTLEPIQRLVATSFDQDRFRQFATPVWLPPRSRRDVVQLLRLEDVPGDVKTLNITTTLINASGSRESMTPPEPGLIPIDGRFPVVAICGDDAAFEIVHAASGGSGLVTTVSPRSLPPLAQGLDTLDALVLAQRDLQLSVSQAEALRQWLLAGGTLWIMLDACDSEVGQTLIGAGWPLLEVDRVRLTSLDVRSDRDQEQWRPDAPATLVRVLPGEAQVLAQCGEWPVSLRHRIGRGQLVVTTLSAPSWMHNGKIVDVMDRATGQYQRVAAKPPIESSVMDPMVRDQIGYQIMSREPVLIALVSFAALIVGSGLWLMRSGRLDKLAWLSPVLAGVTLAVVLGMGYAHRREVPRTLASLNVVEVSPLENRATVTGVAGIYAANAGPLLADGGAPPWPQATTGAARTHRLLMTDLDKWSWQELDLPQAVRVAQLDKVVRLPQRIEAELTFGPEGVEGAWQGGELGRLQDAVIAGTSGAVAPRWLDDARFVAGAGDALPSGRFISGTMSIALARRQAVYAELMSGSRETFDMARSFFPDQVSLMGWTDQWPSGLSVPQDDVVHRDQSLLVVPVRFRRPSAGTRVLIPGAIIPYETVRNRSGIASSLVYDNSRRRWVGAMNSAQEAAFQFQLPAALMPMKVEQAEIELDIRAPQRTVQIVDFQSGNVLAQAASPDGTIRLTLDNAAALVPDRQGAILLTLVVTDPEAADASPTWEITSLLLTVRGVVE